VYDQEDDDMWEFTGVTQSIEDSDYKVVGLGEVIAYDASLLEVANLPLCHRATRSSLKEAWRISPTPNQDRHRK